ncbi:ABC transporter ATP-binding protein [Streptococcus fryi]
MSHAKLELKGIGKSYKDGDASLTILKDLNLSVEAGEFVAILGPSGSGKSTLLSIAGLLLTADTGAIYLDGEKVSSSSQKDLTKLRREQLGFIFQSHHLLPFMTINDQLLEVAAFNKNFSRQERQEAVSTLLKDLGIEGAANKYPNQLSGGQRQRAAIARAFVHQPKLILADEPTASLDADRGRQIAELLRKEVKERQTGAIMVTHDERILDLVDKVYELEYGQLKLVAFGE